MRKNRTIIFENKPYIEGFASVVGTKEGEGPLAQYFDIITEDSMLGEESFEKAETKLQQMAVKEVLKKSNLKNQDIDALFAGDLLNQCIGSSFAARGTDIPYLGVYGACSTMALSLGLASIFVSSGAANKVIAVTSSHFCSAERQYRFPLEYGTQRTPTSQWTVTGSGAIMLSSSKRNMCINSITFGHVVDLGVKDANNMGAAMAPAAADTIKRFLTDTGTKPQDYDGIFTGDLGKVGTALLYELLEKENIDIKKVHNDCGLMIFDIDEQDVHSGASGAGCSASVLTGYILKNLENGTLNNVLFCATGALLSPTSTQQGESIPGIAHLINIKNDKKQ